MLNLAGDSGVTQAIARKVAKPLGECLDMYRMLSEYAKLGETTKRGGVTICPPAMARGIGLHRVSVGGRDNSGNVRQEDVQNTPERRMAISKLVIMLGNLAGRPTENNNGNSGNREYLIDHAHRWFFERSDLEFWCLLAGYDVEKVRKKAKGIVDGISGSAKIGNPRHWSNEDVELLITERAKGVKLDEIALKLGRTEAAVRMMHSKIASERKQIHR